MSLLKQDLVAVETTCKLLGMESEDVKKEALNLYRRFKRGYQGSIGHLETIACVDIARRKLKITVEEQILSKHGGDSKQYFQAFGTVSAICRVNVYPNLDHLIKKFGARRVATRIKELRKAYVQKKSMEVNELFKDGTDFSSRAINAACVVLGLEYGAIKANRLKISREVLITQPRLVDTIHDIERKCGRIVGKHSKEEDYKSREQLDEENDISYYMDGDLSPQEERRAEFDTFVRSHYLPKKKKRKQTDESSESEDEPIGSLRGKRIAPVPVKRKKPKEMHPMFRQMKKRKLNQSEPTESKEDVPLEKKEEPANIPEAPATVVDVPKELTMREKMLLAAERRLQSLALPAE